MVQAQAQGLGTALAQAMVLAWVLAGALAQEQELAVFQALAWVLEPAVVQDKEPAGFQARAQGLWLSGAQVQGLAQAQTLQADGLGLSSRSWRLN